MTIDYSRPNQGLSKLLFWSRFLKAYKVEFKRVVVMSFLVTSPVGLVAQDLLGTYQDRAQKLFLTGEQTNWLHLNLVGFLLKDFFESIISR